MMKMKIISDIHLDIYKNKQFMLKNSGESILVIAGDLCSFSTRLLGLRYIQHYLNSCKTSSVLYVLGNHEYYGSSIKLTEAFWFNQGKKSGGRLVVVGHKPRLVFLKGFYFIGCTLWTDLNYGKSLEIAKQNLNDFALITDFQKFPELYYILHMKAIDDIKTLLNSYRNHANIKKHLCDVKDVIIVTHHPPSRKSVPILAKPSVNRLFYSNLENFIKTYKIKYWFHGHIHFPSNYFIGKCNILCHPQNNLN